MNLLRRILSWFRPQPIGSRPRHPDWDRASREFKKVHPNCIACGTNKYVEVHHIFPVSKFPELEMDSSFWVSLCGEKANRCHRMIGHGGNYQKWNSNVVADARWFRDMLKRIKESS